MLDFEKAFGNTAAKAMECQGASESVSRHKSSLGKFSYVPSGVTANIPSQSP